MRVVEACSAATTRGAAFVSLHCASRITKVHSAAACSAPDTEPVCRINWIRRHDTFPSCRQRCKLHGLFSYVAGDAASYAWRRSDKTAPGHAERGTPGAGKDIRRKISFAYDVIMYEQYVILYYIAGPTCRGPSSRVRASLEI